MERVGDEKNFKFNIIFSIIGFGLFVLGTYLILSASQISMADALEKIPDGEASSEIIAAIILSLSQQRIAQGAIFSFIGGLILTVCMYWTFAEKSNDTIK